MYQGEQKMDGQKFDLNLRYQRLLRGYSEVRWLEERLWWLQSDDKDDNDEESEDDESSTAIVDFCLKCGGHPGECEHWSKGENDEE